MVKWAAEVHTAQSGPATPSHGRTLKVSWNILKALVRLNPRQGRCSCLSSTKSTERSRNGGVVMPYFSTASS